jgi:hypothetical protein
MDGTNHSLPYCYQHNGMDSNEYNINCARYIMGPHIIYRGHAVAQLVEALCYKPKGRGFDSRWCHWNFSLT